MNSEKSQKAKNVFKGLMKKAKEGINLVIGNSEVYSEEDPGGDLGFDPAIMMKINVTFDKEFLPKEKVVKLNVRGSRFFYELKRDIREINSIYIIYPQAYAVQFDVRREEWEKRLIEELNEEYKLSLKKIHFVSQEEVSRRYNRKGITTIKNPYNLKKGELLILAGGFINFDTEGMDLAAVRVNLSKATKDANAKSEKKNYEEKYFDKYSGKAGAYFYVGGEWYHNMFVPELFHPEAPRFFTFRIADDNKSLKFFSDLKKPGIDIWIDEKKQANEDSEKITYTINPDYLNETGVEDFKLSITYDLKEEEPIAEEETTTTIKTFAAVPDIPPPAEAPDQGLPEMEDEVEEIMETEETGFADESLPSLESEMFLLPMPSSRDDDVPSYGMTIGEKKKSVQFYTSSVDKEVSILAPDKDEKIYKRRIGEIVEYSIKLDSIAYSISNTFLAPLDDKELKLYFAWELKSNVKERISLKSDFYLFGREPLDNLDRRLPDETWDQLVRLNKGEDEFWRIGASRDHALLLKGERGHILYNISFSYPVYLVKAADRAKSVIHPLRLEPVSGEKNEEKLTALLSGIREKMTGDTGEAAVSWDRLPEFANFAVLENNDIVIIGSRVFKYVVPVVMESALSDRVRKSILRRIQVNKSVLRK